MRGASEVAAEVAALERALKSPHWSAATRNTIRETIVVLKDQPTAKQIEHTYYVDETAAEFEDGDNELYHELLRVRAWLDAEPGYKAPSEGL